MKNIIGLIGMSSLLFMPDAVDGGGTTTTTTTETAASNTATDKDTEADEADESKDEPIVGEKNGLKFTKQEFRKSKSGEESLLTGWGFPSPQFDNVSQAVTHFDTLIKEQGKTDITGEQIVLDALHTAIDAKGRIRVKAMVPVKGSAGFETEADVAAWFERKAKDNPNKFLISIDEAFNWIPGLREMSAKKQMEKSMLDIKALIKEKGQDHPDVIAKLLELAKSMA